jgi:ABC-type amino acid transport substrate-binding protein
MSWDVFVQDLPRDAQSVADIPTDFTPGVLGTRAWVLAAIAEAAPFADYSDPTWIRISSPEADLEINLGTEDPVPGFAFHIRGGNNVVGLVADILTKLGVRGLDPGADTGIFDPGTAADSLRRWQAYRDRIISAGTPNNRWRGP